MDTGCNYAGISIATYLENVPKKNILKTELNIEKKVYLCKSKEYL